MENGTFIPSKIPIKGFLCLFVLIFNVCSNLEYSKLLVNWIEKRW